MAARVYKRGRVWWGWYHEDGQQICRSTGCRDKRAAETIVTGWERGAADPAHRAANEATLAGALTCLYADRRGRGRADGTLNMYETKGRHLARLLPPALVLVDARAVDHYTASRLEEGAGRNTISKELTTLRAALKLAHRRGEFPAGVAAVVPIGWAPEYEPRERALSEREARALVAALPPDRAAHVAFFLGTAARDAEARRARRVDVDVAAGRVLLRGTKTRTARATIPVTALSRPWIEHALVHAPGADTLFRPWTNVRRDLHEACDRAGIEHCSPNDLRRTCATWLRAAGVEPSLIAGVLRHRDSRMVERVYGKMSPDALSAALDARLVGQRQPPSIACSAIAVDTAARDLPHAQGEKRAASPAPRRSRKKP